MSFNSPAVFTPQGRDLHFSKMREMVAAANSGREALAQGSDDLLERDFGLPGILDHMSHYSGRLGELFSIFASGEVFTPREQADCVAIGTTVVLQVPGQVDEVMVIVGGYGETNPSKRVFSYTAPALSDLIGKQVEDEVLWVVNGEERDATIAQILPPSKGYNQLYAKASPKGEGEQL